MKKILLSISIAALATASTAASATECPRDSRATVVSGTVTTTNISPAIQIGSIDLQLTSPKTGKIVFDEQGALIGRVTEQYFDEWGRPVSLLDHTIVFEGGDTIETSGDVAVINGATSECDLLVDEVISSFWGTKFFKRATGTINAGGTINICGDNNQFALSGTVCLK